MTKQEAFNQFCKGISPSVIASVQNLYDNKYTQRAFYRAWEDSHKNTVEMACEWLNANKVRDDIVGYFLDTQRNEMRDEFIEEFRKAMEAEQ